MSRAQFVLEFIILVTMAIFICIAYLATSTDLLRDTSEQQRTDALNDIGYRVQDEMILAATVDDGYVRNITIQQQADRFVYTLGSDPSGISLTSGATTLFYPLPQYTGAFQKGANIIVKNGTITVSPG